MLETPNWYKEHESQFRSKLINLEKGKKTKTQNLQAIADQHREEKDFLNKEVLGNDQ